MTSDRAPEIKQRLRTGGVVYSAWLTFSSPAIAEVIAGSGFDVLMVDMEHTSVSLETLETVVATVGRWDPVTIVRVPSHDSSLIKRVLDIGIDGIMAPQVMNADQARNLVAAVKYPPIGRRGYGPRRASDFFRDAAYFDHANDRTFVMVQIEHIEAVEVAREIAAVDGIDVLCLGPADLAVSCGLLHDQAHQTVQGALDKVFAAARERNLPVCMGRYERAEDQVALVAKGARFVIASDDLVVLRTGLASHLAEARRLLQGDERKGPATGTYGEGAP
jgi:2-keto-3-deoxy-L-rhamnonate aldolase RhmA